MVRDLHEKDEIRVSRVAMQPHDGHHGKHAEAKQRSEHKQEQFLLTGLHYVSEDEQTRHQ